MIHDFQHGTISKDAMSHVIIDNGRSNTNVRLLFCVFHYSFDSVSKIKFSLYSAIVFSLQSSSKSQAAIALRSKQQDSNNKYFQP